MLQNIINEHIEACAPGEEAIRRAIPALKQVIDETTAMRDSWDLSNDGKQLKTLTRTVAAYKYQEQNHAPYYLGILRNGT